MQEPQPPRSMTVRYGVLFALAMIAVTGIDYLIRFVTVGVSSGFRGGSLSATSLGLASGSLLVNCGFSLLQLALAFLAGMFAARATGKTGSGTIAGMIAYGVSGIVSAAVTVVLSLTVMASAINDSLNASVPPGSGLTGAQMRSFIVVGLVFGSIFGVLVTVGLGAGLGALGGLVGRNQYDKTHFQQWAVPVSGYGYGYPPPYPGYPQQPGYPAYPPPPGAPGTPGAWPGSPPPGAPGTPPAPPYSPPDDSHQ